MFSVRIPTTQICIFIELIPMVNCQNCLCMCMSLYATGSQIAHLKLSTLGVDTIAMSTPTPRYLFFKNWVRRFTGVIGNNLEPLFSRMARENTAVSRVYTYLCGSYPDEVDSYF